MSTDILRVANAERTSGQSLGREDLLWGAALIIAALLYYVPGNSFGGTTFVGGGAVLMPLGFVALAALCYLRTELAVMLLPLSIPLFMMPRHVGARWEFSLSESLVLLCTAAVIVRAVAGWPRLPHDPLAPGSKARSGAASPEEPPLRNRAPAVAPSSAMRPQSQVLQSLRAILPSTPFERPAVLFLLAALLATTAALFRSVALRELRVMIVEPLLYYALVVICLRTPRGVRGALYAAIGGGVLASLLGVGQALFRPASEAVAQYSDQGLRMVSSVYSSPNNLGLLLDRTLPMALAAVLVCRLPRRRLAALVAVALMALVLLLTHSRGAWLATAVTCAVVAGVRFPRWRLPLVIAGAAGALVLVLTALQATGPLARFVAQGHGRSSQARLYVWQSAAQMLRDHPLFGVGPDNFLYYYSGYGFRKLANHPPLPRGWILPSNPNNYVITGGSYGLPGRSYMLPGGADEPFLSHPHNVVLDFWLSTGLLGLAAAVWLLVLFFRHAIALYRMSPEEDTGGTRLTVLMVSAAQLALLVHGLVDNSYFVIDLAMLFWLCLAALAVEWRAATGPGGSR